MNTRVSDTGEDLSVQIVQFHWGPLDFKQTYGLWLPGEMGGTLRTPSIWIATVTKCRKRRVSLLRVVTRPKSEKMNDHRSRTACFSKWFLRATEWGQTGGVGEKEKRHLKCLEALKMLIMVCKEACFKSKNSQEKRVLDPWEMWYSSNTFNFLLPIRGEDSQSLLRVRRRMPIQYTLHKAAKWNSIVLSFGQQH